MLGSSSTLWLRAGFASLADRFSTSRPASTHSSPCRKPSARAYRFPLHATAMKSPPSRRPCAASSSRTRALPSAPDTAPTFTSASAWVGLRYGHEKANPGREAEHPEGAAGGEAQAHDREPPEEHTPRAPDGGAEGSAARRQGRPRPRGPQPAAALRGRQEARHPRTLEHGQVGSDQGDPQVRLNPV